MLRGFYARARKQSTEFEILAISLDAEAEDAAKAAAELKIPFPVLHDADSKVSDNYGVEAIPSLFVIDRNGNLIYTSTGLDASLEILLAQQLGIKNYSPIDMPKEPEK